LTNHMQSFSCSLSGEVPNQEKPRQMKKAPWNRISANAKDLVQQMLLADPNQRPSARQLLEHSWFKVSHFGPISTLSQALMNIVVCFRWMALKTSKRACPLPSARSRRKRAFPLPRVRSQSCSLPGNRRSLASAWVLDLPSPMRRL
jgi:serine/threonine protein kinase